MKQGLVIALVAAAGLAWVGCGRLGRGRPEAYPTAGHRSAPPVGEARSAPAEADSPAAAATQAAGGTYRVVGEAQVVETALLRVNDAFITVDEVLRPIGRQLREAAAGCGDEGRFRLQVQPIIRREVDRQIERTLLVAEAERRLTEQALRGVEQRVEAEYRKLLASVGGSRTLLEEKLRREGTDLERWRKSLRRLLLIRSYLVALLRSKVTVTHQMMLNYYRRHPERFRLPGRLRMQIIAAPFEEFLPAGKQVTAADRRKAVERARAAIEAAAAELARGVDFAEVARKHSRGPRADEGGVWPEMNVGAFSAAKVEAAACKQGPGKVSGIIRDSAGYYIVKTLSYRPARLRPFEEVQVQIEDELSRQQFDRLQRAYAREIRRKACVVGRERFESAAIAQAVRKYLRRR